MVLQPSLNLPVIRSRNLEILFKSMFIRYIIYYSLESAAQLFKVNILYKIIVNLTTMLSCSGLTVHTIYFFPIFNIKSTNAYITRILYFGGFLFDLLVFWSFSLLGVHRTSKRLTVEV